MIAHTEETKQDIQEEAETKVFFSPFYRPLHSLLKVPIQSICGE